jgi:NAD(P)-dependent dehydrogenase (short-subunit alcohol dehydrogenase family)
LISRTRDEAWLDELAAQGRRPLFFSADIKDKPRLLEIRQEVMSAFGRVDVLINGAGGNRSDATTNPDVGFFDLPETAVDQVFAINFLGTFFACQVFGEVMASQKSGVILSISSMAAMRPLTRVVSYSAAKAAVDNFTRWLAVHMAQEYSEKIRVNALAPGFLLTEQNRFLLTDDNGDLTKRGRQILGATPMGRFGKPEEMIGTILWLISDASAFVTGVIVPVDGGFSAFGGV